jgi:cbb3-type cytochrome oxidase subunit 3
MNRKNYKQLGLIGLVMLALAGIFYFFWRSQRAKNVNQIPPDDRPAT